ncbi:putative membrane protein [Paraburkholderia sp. Clong3]|uniref:hypothetical protein n=1 Tax=Paraburkholderia sp. Clong3 TaxID=2991061 RepID=UPI003D1B3EDD
MSLIARHKPKTSVEGACAQTRGDSGGGTKTEAGTSPGAGETIQKIGRHRFAEFVNLFLGRVAALSAGQNLFVKRRLVESLSRRAVYWIALLLLGSALVFVFGTWIRTPDIYLLFRFVWIFGLWGMATPMAIFLLRKTMALPKDVDANAVEQLHWAWAVLIMLTSLWWAAGRQYDFLRDRGWPAATESNAG